MLRSAKTTLILILLFLSCIGFAQDTKEKNKSSLRSEKHILDYSDLLRIGIFTSTPTMEIKMNPTLNNLVKSSSDFKGNFSSTFGFSIGYRGVGISYGFKLPADPASVSSMGKTAFNVLSVKIRKRPFLITLDHRKYKGFYDAYTSNFNKTLPKETPYYIRPDMAVQSYSANLVCNFNWKKYSFSSHITHIDRQIKTKIGFLLKADISYIQLSSDSAFLSFNQRTAFPYFYNIHKIDAYVFKSGPGIGMNLVVFKRIYFALNLFLMSNNLLYRYIDDSDNKSIWRYNSNAFFEGGVGLGYNAKRFYIGIRAGGENNVMSLKGAKIQTSFGSVCLDIGVRLNSPKLLRKVWEKTLTRHIGL
jgi:hypothetical protein